MSISKNLDLKERFLEKCEKDENFRKKVEDFRRLLFTPKTKLSIKEIASRVIDISLDLGLPKPDYSVGVEIPDEKFGFELIEKLPEKIRVEKIPFHETKKYVPVILQPKEDIEKGNEVVAVYVNGFRGESFITELTGYKVIEVTIVWAGEYDPFYGIYSDVWRLIAWGRLEDIETIHLLVKDDIIKATYLPKALYMEKYSVWRLIDPAFSEESGWEKTQHHLKSEDVRELKLYVNTWNHAVSFTDLLPNERKVEQRPFEDFEVREGWRFDVEKIYSMLEYGDESFIMTS